MDHLAAQALRVAAARTLLVAGGGLLVVGAGVVAAGLFETAKGAPISQGVVWMFVGAVSTAYSRLVPPPTWRA
jgi:hypothetical protein